MSSDDPIRPEPLVSVIIPTRNRKRLLEEALSALSRQSLDAARFEVLVVDNCSSDGTEERVDRLRSESAFCLRYHRMPSNRGPVPSRNTGARMARGRFLAFTDDDCRPVPVWLESGLRALQTDDVAFVTGPVRLKPEQVPRAGFFSRDAHIVETEHPTYSWSNIMYRRDVYLEMGGGDESLGFPDFRNRPVECGDTDLAWRIKKRGYRNRFVPGMVVHHELEQMTPVAWLLDAFRIFVLAALVRRHPEIRGALLKGKLFFLGSNVLFYLMVLGAVLGLALHPWAVLLAIPYFVWALVFLSRDSSWSRLPKLPGQLVFLTVRQAVVCLALIYGSFRFRTVVL